MESIKHKMDTMVKEKEAATDKANSLEAEAQEYEKTAAKFEKEVSEIQRKIAKVEDDLDITISVTKDTAEKLELADKEAVDAELQAGALKRRLALLEEETMRNKERLQENIEKCKAIEASGQENEDARKAGEARSFAAEESLEQMETQLEEANEVAKISNQKFEDASRKLKVVEGDCERVIERAEEFETKARELETQIREMEAKVKETEAITIKNGDAFTPAKAFIMMFSNVLIICSMSIQGKSLAGGTPHDEMVESFGLTWLLAGTSLGHIVGAGAILGCQAGGFPGM